MAVIDHRDRLSRLSEVLPDNIIEDANRTLTTIAYCQYIESNELVYISQPMQFSKA